MEVSWLHLVPLLPLIGAAVCGLVGKWLPKGWVYAVALASVLLSFLVGLRAFLGLDEGVQLFHQLAFNWFSAGSLRVDMAFTFDRLSGALTLVVTGVGFLIHVYSVGYMDEDPGYWRYFAYLNLFIAAMLTLVLGDNLVAMFVGWEGVGLCSYLLIGFWFTDEEKAYAGRKAFVVNRIGDFGFLIGIFILFNQTGTVGIPQINSAVLPLGVASMAALCLFIGATGKSAQLPLYIWLPDAMAGPTPVSALIHAATMVTAGVYMVARLSFLYVQAPGVMAAVATIGVLTALLGAVIGTAQMDIKRVLAYSTVSQLGYMFLGLGVGATGAAVFHLVTHAFFKALLFLGAGSVIHGLGGEQDMERMGGLGTRMRITFVTMAAGTLAIAGVPPFSGFFSKDEILWGAWQAAPLLAVIGLLVAFLTAFYTGRLFCMTFLGECRASEDVQHHIHESPAVMTLPLVLLAVLACAGGFLDVPGLLAGEAHPAHAPLAFMLLATVLAAGGLGLAWALYVKWPGLPSLVAWRLGAFYRLVRDKFRVDELYDAAVVGPVFALAEVSATRIDPQLIDGAVNGAGRVVSATSGAWRRFQTGNVQHYALSFLAGALALLGYWMTR